VKRILDVVMDNGQVQGYVSCPHGFIYHFKHANPHYFYSSFTQLLKLFIIAEGARHFLNINNQFLVDTENVSMRFSLNAW